MCAIGEQQHVRANISARQKRKGLSIFGFGLGDESAAAIFGSELSGNKGSRFEMDPSPIQASREWDDNACDKSIPGVVRNIIG